MRLGMKTVVFAILLSFSSVAFSQVNELIDRQFSGSSKSTNPQVAKKEIQDQAALKISEEIIKELIGEERFNKNKSLINTKIIRNSSRYIPYSKATPLNQEKPEESTMSVSMKVSLKDLRQFLQETGLLNDNDSIPVVLPMVSWVDRVGGNSYRWWVSSDRNQSVFLNKEARVLEESLRNSFEKNNFYMMRPIANSLGRQVPYDFQVEKISPEDSSFFAQYFNAPVIVDGQILLKKGENNTYQIEVRLTALQVSNGRTIADVSRRFETSPGSFEMVVDRKIRETMDTTVNDLALQVRDASQRGSLGTSVLRLTILGRNTLPVIESVKEKIRSEVTQVKNIRERLVGSDSVSFELDSSATSADLSAKLQGLNINGRRLSKVSMSNDEIVLKWVQ